MPWTLRSVRKGEPPSGVEQPVVFAIALLARWFTPTARGPLRVMIRRSWSLAAGGDPDRRAGLVRRRPRLLPSTNQLVAHLRRPIGGNECSRAPGTRVRLTPQYRPMRRPLSKVVRLSAGGNWIRTLGSARDRPRLRGFVVHLTAQKSWRSAEGTHAARGTSTATDVGRASPEGGLRFGAVPRGTRPHHSAGRPRDGRLGDRVRWR